MATVTTPFVQPTTTYVPSTLVCNVCHGTGIVYGLDGRPYLCPKCGGNQYPQPQITWYWTSPTTDPQPITTPITICIG